MNWRWVGTTAVLTAGVLTYGVFMGRNRMDQNAVEAPAALGYYFRNAVITETTAAGAPRLRIAARSIEQNPQDDSVSLEQVNVDYLSIPDRPWNLQADSGHLPAGSSALTFEGNVTLQPGRTAAATDTGDDFRNAVMHTEFLTIDSKKNIATTNAPVAIDVTAGGSKQNRVTAQGLYADLNSSKVKLNSSVHGRFVSKGAPPKDSASGSVE